MNKEQVIACIDQTLAMLENRLDEKQPIYQPDNEWNVLMDTCLSLRLAKTQIQLLPGQMSCASESAK